MTYNILYIFYIIYILYYIYSILYIYIESSISIGHVFLELPVRSHRVTMSAALPAGNLDHTWLITPVFNGISRIIELHNHIYIVIIILYGISGLFNNGIGFQWGKWTI